MTGVLIGAGRRLKRWDVAVVVVALLVVGGGGAYAVTAPAPGARPADLSVSITGPATVSASTPSATRWSETIHVHNAGPGRARPVVLVGAPGHVIVRSVNGGGGDIDQGTVVGTVLDRTRTSPKCVPLGAETSVEGSPTPSVQSGPVACAGPFIESGGSTSFVVAFDSNSCQGSYAMTTTALVTSSLVDPNGVHDRASKTVNVTSTGCG